MDLTKNTRLLLGGGGVVLIAAAVVGVQVDDATAALLVKVVGVVGGALVGALATRFGVAPKAPEGPAK